MIFKDVHEPIIDRETFEEVRKTVGRTKYRMPKTGEKSMFSDLLRCADCQSKLWYHINSNNRETRYFSCSNYEKDYRGSCRTRHYVRADAIEKVVSMELHRLASFLRRDEDAFAEILAQKSDKNLQKERKQTEDALQKAIVRSEAVSNLYQKLYEDNSNGKVSDEWFLHLSHKYETEQLELKKKIASLQQKLGDMRKDRLGREAFLNAVRRFLEMEVLTGPLLRELIDHIDVYEVEGTGKNRTQRIVISYRFVGYFEIPEEEPIERYTADLRKGIAVKYIPAAD